MANEYFPEMERVVVGMESVGMNFGRLSMLADKFCMAAKKERRNYAGSIGNVDEIKSAYTSLCRRSGDIVRSSLARLAICIHLAGDGF